ncbi:MAG: proline racemase family protein, partial [Chlorobi bacterium]|nr:proline racemase family protein [Chlorobiota bacterium]
MMISIKPFLICPAMMKKKKMRILAPPESNIIHTIEMHTGGEPLRVISGGLPDIPGKTILEKRRFFKEHYDNIRTALLWEPRGHRDMYGAIITEPVTGDGDFGVIFLHNEGYSTMCGHAIIALTRLVLESGFIDRSGKNPEIRIDTPAGRVVAIGHRDNKGKVVSSSFRNVPSFLLMQDETVEVPGIGRVDFDVAFGGAFYAFTDAQVLGLDMDKRHAAQLADIGMKIKKAITDNFNI